MALLSGRTDDRRRLAVRWITEIMAAVFVDEMRLLYVGISALARRANVERYSEFVAICEQHLDDFNKQVGRYIGDLETTFISEVQHIEQRQLWAFSRFKSGPCPPAYGDRYFQEMRRTAEEMHTLCTSVHINGYQSTIKMIAEIGEHTWSLAGEPRGLASVDSLWMVRLNMQSIFLNRIQDGEKSPILTIADDVHQNFALAYCIVDRWLMQHIATGQI
jgi:hypothetical protein